MFFSFLVFVFLAATATRAISSFCFSRPRFVNSFFYTKLSVIRFFISFTTGPESYSGTGDEIEIEWFGSGKARYLLLYRHKVVVAKFKYLPVPFAAETFYNFLQNQLPAAAICACPRKDSLLLSHVT